MKQSTKLLLLSACLLSSCGNQGGSSTSSASGGIVENAVYLDLFEDYAFDLENVSIEDPSLLSYENGVFSAKDKAGETSARGTKDGIEYRLSFGIAASGVLPKLRLDYSSLSMNVGDSFAVTPSLTYNGKDVLSYADLSFSKEEETACSSLAKGDGQIFTVTASSLGTEHYSIHTTFLGSVLSKPLSVTVAETSLTVIGRTMSYDNEGAYLALSMKDALTSPIALDDIEVVYGANRIPTAALSFTVGDASIAKIENGKILPLKKGTTSLSIAYGAATMSIRLVAYKPLVASYETSLSDPSFVLDLPVTIEANSRSYAPSSSTKEIPVSSQDGAFVGMSEVVVDGESIDCSGASFSMQDGKAVLPLSVFGTTLSGKHRVSVFLETSATTVSYSFDALFVTKRIETAADIKNYVSQNFAGDKILGYYQLACDINYAGTRTPGSWTTSGWDFSAGFRGTLDGCGHAIEGMTTAAYGISGIVGMGALFKNIRFTNLHYSSWAANGNSSTGTALFCRGTRFSSYENIEITLSSDSVTDVGEAGVGKSIGILATDDFASCSMSDVTVNANGKSLLSLCGKQAGNATFSNVKVVCASLQYVYGAYSSADGVTVIEG